MQPAHRQDALTKHHSSTKTRYQSGAALTQDRALWGFDVVMIISATSACHANY